MLGPGERGDLAGTSSEDPVNAWIMSVSTQVRGSDG